MEINGIAHIALVVNRFNLCAPFYEKLLNFLGLKTVHKNEKYLYCVGGKTAVGIGASDEMHKNEKFDQNRIGLHHLCFRARERSDIDQIHQFLLEMKAKIVHPPEDGPWGLIRSFSKIPMGFVSKSITFLGKEFLKKGKNLILRKIISKGVLGNIIRICVRFAVLRMIERGKSVFYLS